MKIVEAQGYNKEKALENSNLDITLDKLKNATQAWKKAGSPVSTKPLNTFAAEYLKKQKVMGMYIVVDGASDDTRLRPYSVINEVTKGKRKQTTVYQIKEASFNVKTSVVKSEETNEEGEVKVVETDVKDVSVTSLGAIVGKAAKKDEAFKLMKELIEENKRNYVVEIAKETTEGQRYAGYGVYTPSKSAKLGKFMFFINE